MDNTEEQTVPTTPHLEDMHAELMNADGTFTPGWFSRFEELKPYAATLSKFQRPEALAKSYANLEKLRGYPDTADAARMAAFREAVGLPPKPEEFAMERPEDTPDELWNEELVKQLSGVAYEYGVPPKALAALVERYTAEGKRFLERCCMENQEAIAHADAELQHSWGPAYEENMRAIESFLRTMGERTGVDVQKLVEPFKKANPDVKVIFHVHQLAYTRDYKWLEKVKLLKDEGVTVVDWGGMLHGILQGTQTVPGTEQTFNENSFVISQSEGDGYHPNLLVGYVTALMTYCAITGEKAEGQTWQFPNSPVMGENAIKAYRTSYYTYNKETNFDTVLLSETEMLGFQKLIDQYMQG